MAKVFSEYEMDLSEKLIINSLRYAEILRDSVLIGEAYQIFGNLKYNVKSYSDAREYYKKSLGIYLRHNEVTKAAGIYNNLGILSNIMTKDSSSFKYYEKAITININEKNYLKLAINYLNVGVDYSDWNNFDEAIKYFEKSLNIVKEHNYVRLYPWIYNNLSNYYLEKLDFQNSLDYAYLALEIASQHSNKLQELGALEQLRDIYAMKSDTIQAYHYLNKIIILTDSINRNNRLKELDILETRFKFEEQIKKQEFEKAKLEADYYRKELTYVTFLLISGFMGLTFVFLFVWQKARVKRKALEQKNTLLEKEKLKKDLEYKNKELTTNVMYLLRKNEFISSISEKLKNLTNGGNDEKNEHIRKIILELDKSISENNWEEFEIRFKEVYVGFYNRLSQKQPDLTSNELRLCAFLKLNMTTKEIADITFQSVESIKKARYRLRKKLNLVRDDSLITYLSKL